MEKVAVNGITGHLGYTVAKQLRDKGYRVRGILRDRSKIAEHVLLRDLDIEIVEADMRDGAAMSKALQGQDGFFQVAAVFDLRAKNPRASVIEPNVLGTEASVRAAAGAGVPKIVYTSSIAAVGVVDPGQPALDESHWNLASGEPYALSKALSEQKAFETAAATGINLVSVLPGTILGPGFNQPTDSIDIFYSILAGRVPMAMPFSFSYVDVRDVAAAQIGVYEHPNSKGRYIATGETWHLQKVLQEVLKIHPEAKTSTNILPSWIAKIFPAIEAFRATVTGTKPAITRSTLREYMGKTQVFGSTRLYDEIGWRPRPVSESIAETLAWIAELGRISARG